jgi:N6-adenosine-specific RNA methylase IME4
MSREIELAIRKRVPTVSSALKALEAMDRQLASARTYDEIRRVIREASAFKVLLGHVQEVKTKAEDTILVASVRIGEEIKRVPKAAGRPAKILTRSGKNKSGRRGIGLSGTSRSRLTKIAEAGIAEVKRAAKQLRAEGKDATPRAVATLLVQGDKKERRADREKGLAVKQRALPEKRYGVIVADPNWRWEPRSRITGMDRAADNHYPTSPTAEIARLPVQGIAADDCVLWLWATIPMVEHALEVMLAWGFDYKSHYVWAKDKIGPGYWTREKHELLLIGTRGDIPCPAPGTQWDSVIPAERREHSAKPEIFLRMIEEYYPTLPKIELYRRGPVRPGWDAWGLEAEMPEAAE